MPKKMGLYWFMPALEKSRVGSFTGTTGLEGLKVCPFALKKSMNVDRTTDPGQSVGEGMVERQISRARGVGARRTMVGRQEIWQRLGARPDRSVANMRALTLEEGLGLAHAFLARVMGGKSCGTCAL